MVCEVKKITCYSTFKSYTLMERKHHISCCGASGGGGGGGDVSKDIDKFYFQWKITETQGKYIESISISSKLYESYYDCLDAGFAEFMKREMTYDCCGNFGRELDILSYCRDKCATAINKKFLPSLHERRKWLRHQFEKVIEEKTSAIQGQTREDVIYRILRNPAQFLAHRNQMLDIANCLIPTIQDCELECVTSYFSLQQLATGAC